MLLQIFYPQGSYPRKPINALPEQCSKLTLRNHNTVRPYNLKTGKLNRLHVDYHPSVATRRAPVRTYESPRLSDVQSYPVSPVESL